MAEPETDPRPWEKIEKIADAGSAERLETFFDELPASETARAMAHLDADEQTRVFQTLAPGAAAGVIEEMSDIQAAEIMETLSAVDATAILRELATDDRADLLSELPEAHAEAILAEMEPEEARDLRELASYDDDTAGGVMAREFLMYRVDATVNDVIQQLRERAEHFEDDDVQYAYVEDEHRKLVGVLRLRDLLVSPSRTLIAKILIPNPLSVRVDTSLDELWSLLDRYAFLAFPVVDAAGQMVGIVQRSAIEVGVGERAELSNLKRQGIVGGEELRTMSVASRAGRRLSWLSVNIVLNVASASVIAIYQDTLAQVIALAVFLPIISDMSGCSGNQAVAVSLRELTLGLIRPTELFRVWLQEISVGLLNGVVLGGLLAGVAYLWKGNPWLGIVVGVALAVNTIVAVSIGGIVPLFLRRFGFDPALASGPILTTITDMCGFLLVLGLATMWLPRLL